MNNRQWKKRINFRIPNSIFPKGFYFARFAVYGMAISTEIPKMVEAGGIEPPSAMGPHQCLRVYFAISVSPSQLPANKAIASASALLDLVRRPVRPG